MKKIITCTIFLASLIVLLSACGNSSEDKVQGEWKASNDVAKQYVGEKVEINNQDVKVSGKGDEGTDMKYVKVEDKKDDKDTYIKFYKSKPKDDDEDDTALEGELTFEDDGKEMIVNGAGINFKFTKA
ncbi:hypothetical protein BUZ69_10805 [Staphylococcus saprophyticus]|uniref:hypothetical protein n=1 Tax=Staphylococcus saprophyticus TaxID=29385 RepID=UPI000D1F0F2B|nr:hypothetical protein [Staphylococcus saprophyticus]PTK45340.1 hypothetical protein BUZ69_10805 [Staphylococcus saprophyticus]